MNTHPPHSGVSVVRLSMRVGCPIEWRGEYALRFPMHLGQLAGTDSRFALQLARNGSVVFERRGCTSARDVPVVS